MHRHRKNNDLLKTLKDYAVPIIGFILIIFLVFNIFSGDSKSKENISKNGDNSKNQILESGVKISLVGENTKAFITYKNGKKVEITDDILFEKGQTLSVEEGKVEIIVPTELKMKLSRPGELVYKEDGSFLLNSGNLWVEALSDSKIFMKYANVYLQASSISNLSQNALESTIYNISGDIKVSTLYGLEAQILAGKKITISSKNTNAADFDIKNAIENIDDYFKLSKWFIENGGDKITSNINTNSGSLELTSSGKTDIKDNLDSNIKLDKLISFDNLQDESYSKNSLINITGRYDPLKIGKITFNNNIAKLNSKLGTFSYKLSLENKVNDIVIKLYDLNSNLISKKVFTIYSKGGLSNKNTKINSKIENYKVDASNYIIYAPSTTGKFSTTSSQVTIRGKVLDKRVKAVLVNDYKLRSFNGKTWRYHAFVDQGTLKPGANIYEIKYLDGNSKIIYKDYYNIFYKTKNIVKKISSEAKIKN